MAKEFFENAVLFGHDAMPGIVAVEVDVKSGGVRLFVRGPGPGELRVEDDRLRPFLWVREPVGDVPGVACRKLSGALHYGHLVTCESWNGFLDLRAALKSRGVDHFAPGDAVQQYLTATGRTLFKGLAFDDLRRMQVDIETHCHPDFEFSNPERESDHLLAIAVSDSTGWEELIEVDAGDAARSEMAAIARLGELIRERDPDVIEGHNLFKFDLPYLAARAKRHRLKPGWGRDGSRMQGRPSRLQVAERTINYTRFEVFGRHLVDTFLLVQYYDIGSRELESFGLKEVARHFGIAGGAADGGARVYLEGRGIQQAYFADRAAFREYALQDARETRALSDLLSRSYFTQAQIFPYNYQSVIVRGNATKIDALFLREYLRRGHSLPATPEAQQFEGGYTDVFMTGVARPVWHCDVTSLYPSVMLQFGFFPANDVLGIFKGMLSDLREFRIEAKRRMQELAADPAARRGHLAAQALQATFKILINSFYGYLGFGQGHFADFDAAGEVTRAGRELLKQMVAWLNAQGARVVEIDTDGVYFIPTDGATAGALEAGIRKDVLPAGIDIEFDTGFEAMFSYKAKNYALLRESGELVVKGGALKSRGLEKFQRDFMERMIRHLIAGEAGRVREMRDEFERAIRGRQWPVAMFMKTETLQDSLGNYQAKIKASSRNRAAAYELALASGRGYQPGDQVSYYITGDKKRVSAYESAKLACDWDADNRDENVEYYIAKLDDLVRKFSEFLTGEEGLEQGLLL